MPTYNIYDFEGAFIKRIEARSKSEARKKAYRGWVKRVYRSPKSLKVIKIRSA